MIGVQVEIASLQIRPKNLGSPDNREALPLTNTIVALRARLGAAPESNLVSHAVFVQLEQGAADLVLARVRAHRKWQIWLGQPQDRRRGQGLL